MKMGKKMKGLRDGGGLLKKKRIRKGGAGERGLSGLKVRGGVSSFFYKSEMVHFILPLFKKIPP